MKRRDFLFAEIAFAAGLAMARRSFADRLVDRLVAAEKRKRTFLAPFRLSRTAPERL
jgi:hypothetical protein